MMAFAQQIAAGHEGPVVFGMHGQKLGISDLQSSGVAFDIGSDTRIAVKLHDPLDVIRALAALDGQVEAVLLLSHALSQEVAVALCRSAGCDVLLQDTVVENPHGILSVDMQNILGAKRRADPLSTIWLMTTSGTTGVPKIIPHTLRSLSRSVYRFPGPERPVWGLLYDPTRFAGLQVVLQAIIGGGQLVAVDTSAPLGEQIAGLASHGCTHLSATPTLWRRLLMVPNCQDLHLKQITMGGEIADQSTLNALRRAFPNARVSHIYASTEAGVGFSVTDGLAGFPLSYLEKAPGNVRLSIRDDVLWLCPPVTALQHGSSGVQVDEEGYVCSGDRVAVKDDRVFFLGRENGLINIGGVKVYPETVEAVVRTVPGVALVQVSAKRSPVTGALVLAQVQLEPGVDADMTRQHILQICRANLEREAVPAIIRFVDGFKTNAAGKLMRTGTEE